MAKRKFVKKVDLDKLVTKAKGVPKLKLKDGSPMANLMNDDRLKLIENDLCPLTRPFVSGEFDVCLDEDKIPKNVVAVFLYAADENNVRVNRRVPLTQEDYDLIITKNTVEEVKEVLKGKLATIDILV